MNSADWWARKMRGEPPQKLTAPLPPTPVARPTVAQQPRVPFQPEPLVEDRCPECRSGNFMGKGSSAKRCFDCGYVQGRDFQHSTSGAIAEGPVQKAMQVESPGYQPNLIVGKVE